MTHACSLIGAKGDPERTQAGAHERVITNQTSLIPKQRDPSFLRDRVRFQGKFETVKDWTETNPQSISHHQDEGERNPERPGCPAEFDEPEETDENQTDYRRHDSTARARKQESDQHNE